MDYYSHCGYCNETRTDINNFYCLKNRGACENCYKKVRLNKKRSNKNTIDPSSWSKKRRYDETGDKKKTKKT